MLFLFINLISFYATFLKGVLNFESTPTSFARTFSIKGYLLITQNNYRSTPFLESLHSCSVLWRHFCISLLQVILKDLWRAPLGPEFVLLLKINFTALTFLNNNSTIWRFNDFHYLHSMINLESINSNALNSWNWLIYFNRQ